MIAMASKISNKNSMVRVLLGLFLASSTALANPPITHRNERSNAVQSVGHRTNESLPNSLLEAAGADIMESAGYDREKPNTEQDPNPRQCDIIWQMTRSMQQLAEPGLRNPPLDRYKDIFTLLSQLAAEAGIDKNGIEKLAAMVRGDPEGAKAAESYAHVNVVAWFIHFANMHAQSAATHNPDATNSQKFKETVLFNALRDAFRKVYGDGAVKDDIVRSVIGICLKG